MDTTYIKMCEKAEEIQELRFNMFDWQEGDCFFTVFDEIRIFHKSWEYQAHHPIKHRAECVWLPRQDQLQEMMGLPQPKLITEFYAFAICHEISSVIALNYYNSMKQIWLAFVMKEEYSKVWDGEQWITSNR